MYACAVRETVFVDPAVIRRVNADFVPVFVSPSHSSIAQSGDAEGRLFRSVYRSRVVDQGLCVLNAGGLALDWTVMFDNEASIIAFLDHALKRYDEHPDARQPVITERYVRFTSQFYVTPDLQELMAMQLAAGPGPVRLPDEFGRQCVMHAYLGQIDVRPLSNPQGGTSDLKQCDFWAERAGDPGRPGLMRVEGRSAVTVEAAGAEPRFHHEITLVWEGFFEREGRRISRLALSARGTEKLQWSAEAPPGPATRDKAAFLVAGHPIDFAGAVRYGIIAEPLAALVSRAGPQPWTPVPERSRTE